MSFRLVLSLCLSEVFHSTKLKYSVREKGARAELAITTFLCVLALLFSSSLTIYTYACCPEVKIKKRRKLKYKQINLKSTPNTKWFLVLCKIIET